MQTATRKEEEKTKQEEESQGAERRNGVKKDNDDPEVHPHDLLLSPTALALSLAPPRAPPHGTHHHAILLHGHRGGSRMHPPAGWIKEAMTALTHHDASSHTRHEPAQSKYTPQSLQQQQKQQPGLVSNKDCQNNNKNNTNKNLLPSSRKHPHVLPAPVWADRMTRSLSLVLPLPWIHAMRDGGGTRFLFDMLVTTVAAPTMGLTAPVTAGAAFVQRMRQCQRIYYHHDHDPKEEETNKEHAERQYVDLYLPNASSSSSSSPTQPYRLVFFVHGGAWGSGLPWFYRLVATSFLNQGHAVAVLGYRTYPTGQVADQVDDCQQAARVLAQMRVQNDTATSTNGSTNGGIPLFSSVTVMGHSSGAHVGLLWLVDRAKRRLAAASVPEQQQQQQQLLQEDALTIDSFIGLSGPYDIPHHFDYEAARGVEEFSPMKAACGTTRAALEHNSPVRRLQKVLHEHAVMPSFDLSSLSSLSPMPPKMLLVHGMHDDTVPFTATSHAARMLRATGLCHQVDECYLAREGHQDLIVQVMLGGNTQRVVQTWMQDQLGSGNPNHSRTTRDNDDDKKKNEKGGTASTHSAVMMIPSRL